MVWPDRSPHPGLYEFKGLAAPVRLGKYDADKGTLSVRSRLDFDTLAWLRGEWTLKLDGRVLASGELPPLNAGPREKQFLPLHLPDWKNAGGETGGEAFLNVRFLAARATAWCDAGHEVGRGQIALGRNKPVARKRTHTSLDVSESPDGTVTVSNDAVSVGLSLRRGEITSLRWHGGEDLLVHGPRLQVWRGATDNDGIKLQDSTGRPLGRWLAQGLDKLESLPVAAKIKRRRGKAGALRFTTEHFGSCAASPRAVRHRCDYTLYPDGRLRADNVFDVDDAVPDLPRLGVTLTLRASLENLRWFGRGPLENYCDRQRTSLVDLYSDTVTGQYVPYVMPQEHGNHTDVRWLSLDDGRSGLRVRAVSGGTLEFSASHYTAADLYAARHTTDLVPRAETILNLDCHQRGLGTASCGPDALERYRIGPGRYAWSYVLEPANG